MRESNRPRALPAVLSWLWLALSCLAVAWFHSDADPDLWHRLAVGAVWEQTGSVLPRDVFSYMPTLPTWIDHEWGGGVVFWLVADAAGAAGLFALKLLLLAGLMACVVGAARARFRRFPSWTLAFYLLVLLGVAPGFTTTIRCQAFTFFGFAAYLLVLETWRRTRRPSVLAALPVLMMGWANVHGGYLAGLGLIGLYVLGEALNRRPVRWLLLAGVVTAAATLINPYGFALWSNVTDAVGRARPYMAEWTPLWQWPALALLGAKGLVVLTVFAAAGVARRLTRGRPIDFTAALVIIATLVLGVRHVRHLPLFAMAAGVFLPPALHVTAAALRRWRLRQRGTGNLLAATGSLLGRLALPLLFALMAVSLFPMHWPVLRLPAGETALGAVDYLKRHGFTGKVVVPFNASSYAMYRLFPARVNIDGRFEQVYPVETFNLATAFQFGHDGGGRLLDDYPPDAVITDARTVPAHTLRHDPAWRLAYQDADAWVFVPANSPLPTEAEVRDGVPDATALPDPDDFRARWQAFQPSGM